LEDFDDEMTDLLIRNYKNLSDIRKTMTELTSGVDTFARSDGFNSQPFEANLRAQVKPVSQKREESLHSAKSSQRGNSKSRQLPKIKH
jgi:hypothetical protein